MFNRRPILIIGSLLAGFLIGTQWGFPGAWGEQGDSRRTQAFSQAVAGWHLLQTGDYRRAERAFTQAMTLVPDEPSFYVGLGVSQLRLAKEEQAALMFERAIQLDPHSTKAHELLGDLHARKDGWAAAVEHYGIAVRQDPNDVSIQERLLSAKRSYAAQADLDVLYTAHFAVKFQGTTDRQLARDVADHLERIFLGIGRELGYFPAKPIAVVLYPGQRFQEATLSPHWARGLFDGTLRLSVDGLRRNPVEVVTSLRHEYTHALVHELADGHAPAWLSEGLAQFFEGGQGAGQGQASIGSPDEVMPLHLLHGSFVGLPRRAAQQAYADSYSAVQALIARHGLSRIRDLLETLATQQDFARAFEGVLHERYRDFEVAWMGAQTGRRF